MRFTKLLVGAAAVALACPGIASAQSMFSFTLTGAGGNVLGSGTITTGAANPAGSFFTPSLAITNITGTYRNGDITGLLSAGSYFANDNILYPMPTNGAGYLDLRGVAFSTTRGNADIYFGLGGYGTIFTSNAGAVTTNIGGTFTITPVAAAVPEAASWAMMIAGFGVVGGAMRYRRKASAVRFA